MEELVQFIAEALVEEPQAVRVYRKETRRTTILKLRVAPDDTGRVIGRNGRVANAMRTLLDVSTRQSDRDVILEID
ncbi:MAG: KH domain-containing protein [Caldilineaceae bacterium]|nr:KH domain-containing protein [Caldilineaceae bacterium]